MSYTVVKLEKIEGGALALWIYGRVWLHVNFFAHVFREENIVRMEY